MTTTHHIGIYGSTYRGPDSPADPYFSYVTFLAEFGPSFDAPVLDRGPNSEVTIPYAVPNRVKPGKFGRAGFAPPSDTTTLGGQYIITNLTNFDFSNSNWCVEGWFKSAAESTNGVSNETLISRFRAVTNQHCWTLGYTRNDAGNIHTFIALVSVDGSADLTASFKTGTSGNDGWTTAQIFDGNWHHFALVRNGTTVKLYIDGLAGATTAAVSTNSIWNDSNTAIVIGGRTNSATIGTLAAATVNTRYALDEIRISVGTPRYTANFTPSTSKWPRNSIDDANWSTVKLLLDFEDSTGIFNNHGSIPNDFLQTGLSGQNYFDSYGMIAGGNSHKINSHAGFDFSNGDFTVEAIFKTGAAVTSVKQLMGVWGASGDLSWRIGISTSSALSFQYTIDGSTIITTSFGAITTATVYSVAVSRVGTTIYLYLNGTQVATVSIGTGTIKDSLTNQIQFAFGGSTSSMIIKAIRITKGLGRYNASTCYVITVPIANT